MACIVNLLNCVDIEAQKSNEIIPQLYRMVPDPYVIAFSKSKRRKYWFNTATNSSSFECPRDAVVNFERAFCSRVTWNWKDGVRTHPEQDFPTDEAKVQAESFISHVRSALPK